MKKLMTIIVAFILNANFTIAQKGPFIGTGELISKNFDYKDFDKISFEDFDGRIEVEIGKAFSIKIDIDKSLENRLFLKEEKDENLLRIGLEGNKNGKLYLENNNTIIRITMPEASVVSHRGNTNMKVRGIIGRYFRLEHTGNGDVTLEGKTDELDIKKMGNGNIKAKNLIAITAKVKSYGNGNVIVNSHMTLSANGTGNGSIMQAGTGKIDATSGIIGNGDVRKL